MTAPTYAAERDTGMIMRDLMAGGFAVQTCLSGGFPMSADTVYAERVGPSGVSRECDRCHCITVGGTYRVVDETDDDYNGSWDDGSWEYCGTCTRRELDRRSVT